jgi:anti-anti-sigma regulatory factor
MSEPDIKCRQIGSRMLLVQLGKRLDNNNAMNMAHIISSAQDEEIFDIRINMAELELLSSSGIGSIVGFVERSRSM